jgi:hypothetical protein
MRFARLRELEAMAAKLPATARKLPQGKDRQDAFREISKFRNKIAALTIADQSAQRTTTATKGK